MDTLLLDQTDWDLVLDINGNIAMASEPYALAQDVASAIRTFIAECWYDITQGIPNFQNVLGHLPPVALLKQYLVNAALTVPGVVTATVVIQSFTDRNVVGQVQFTDTTGASQIANF